MILLAGIALALFVVPDAWDVPVVVGFAILEVSETVVTWRLSNRAAPKVGPETLIGATGRTLTDFRPIGTVRVNGEHWQARIDSDVAAGQLVRVTGRERLTLLVEPAEPAGDR